MRGGPYRGRERLNGSTSYPRSYSRTSDLLKSNNEEGSDQPSLLSPRAVGFHARSLTGNGQAFWEDWIK